MKSFISSLSAFALILFAVILFGILLPATPLTSTTLVFGKLKMDSLLRSVKPPRLILLGGSNLSLSINSQLLKDSLQLNPVNTAITWSIGFVYMFENTLKYVKPNDIIVASLEYNQFFDGNMYGGDGLVRTIFDVAPSEFYHLHARQYLKMAPHLPLYALSKFRPKEYFFKRNPLEIYDRNATNEYGDNCKHWNLSSRVVLAETPFPTSPDRNAFDILKEFESAIQEKGAILLIAFPALQRSTFENQKTTIKAIEKEFKDRHFRVIGYPERYLMPDDLLFDSPYHLIKKGVDLRTELLIEDLKLVLDFTGPFPKISSGSPITSN